MSFNAYIERDFRADTLRFFVREVQGSRVVFYRSDGTQIAQDLSSYQVQLEPTLEIPSDCAPVLLAELARFLGAVEHPAQLRADYMAERARVDKLIESMRGFMAARQ